MSSRSIETIVSRANDGAARPIFSLATFTYGVAVFIAGVGLWEGQNGPTVLSSIALIAGPAMMGAGVLGLVVERWRKVAAGAAVPAAVATALAVVGLLGVVAIPNAGGLDPDRMAWSMVVGLFSLMWTGTVVLAHAVGKRGEAIEARANAKARHRGAVSIGSPELAT